MKHLAIDIGAESGRAVLGWREGGKLRIEEVHRFPNPPIARGESLFWDIEHLVGQVNESVAQVGGQVASIGIDTWAVDYVLLDAQGNRLGDPHCYRDLRTQGATDRAFAVVPAEDLYRATGIQIMPFNTVFQLLCEDAETLKAASAMLTIPDYLNYRLSGRQASEFTNATTTQCYDPRTGDWAWDVLTRLGIPHRIFPPLVQPGTVLGTMPLSDVRVVAVAAHDTGSAVAGSPLTANSAWISSGTWSIMGVEVDQAIINEDSFHANFTNEGGVNGSFRFSKNVAGLWLLQQCRAAWGAEDSYEELVLLAEAAVAAETIDPDDPDFFAPGDMPAKINAKLARPTSDKGVLVRIILESLARRYAQVLGKLEAMTGKRLERIHVVGGGSQNRLLNQLTADACRVPVVAGPVEATAIGNILMQMVALGTLSSLAEGRRLVAESFPLETFNPR